MWWFLFGMTGVAVGLMPLSKAKWGAKVGQASKAGRLREVSLKSTLSVLTMAGSLALFSTIENALAPDDTVGRAWLENEKAEYLETMCPWFKKPFTLAGIIVMVLIITIGGGLGVKSRRSKKKVEEEREDEQMDEEKGYRLQQALEEPRVMKERKEREPVNI